MWCQCGFAIVPFLVTLLVSSVASPLWTLQLHVVKAYIALSRRMSPKSDLKVLFKKKKKKIRGTKPEAPTYPGKPGKWLTNFTAMENIWKMREKSVKCHGNSEAVLENSVSSPCVVSECKPAQTAKSLQESLINQINLYTYIHWMRFLILFYVWKVPVPVV